MPYARLTTPIEDDDLSRLILGVVYILVPDGDDDDEEARFLIRLPDPRPDRNGRNDGGTQYYITREQVIMHFDLLDETEGEIEYDAHTRNLRDQLRQTNAEIERHVGSDSTSRLMAGETLPHVAMLNAPEPEAATAVIADDEPPAAGGIIETTDTRQKAGAIRNQLHAFRRDLSGLGERASGIRAEIQVRLNEKLALFQEHADGLSRYVAKLQGAIETVNLYLGREQEITVIRTGARAAMEEPLRIRQMVLSMDEEMAVLYPEGIDYQQIDDFDQWIQQPENLDAILPEQKGIVVLIPTLRTRDYHQNEVVNAMLNKENFKSYWLLRNGENLYRIHADIEVRGTLFPRSQELAEYFHPQGGQMPRPGSQAYYQAMDREEGKMLHTLKVTLLLQGILDRTLIFAPYAAGERPNLLDPATFKESVILVRDAEGWISDGRPTFKKWLKATNSKLIPGDRIVGTFRADYREDRRNGDGRIFPSGANGYDSEEIRTIAQKDAQSFKFSFDRSDEVYRKSGYRGHKWQSGGIGKPKTKGSYTIYPTDDFFLNFDAITLEEIDYYIHDRRSRSSYFGMMATLQSAKRLKLKEAAEEAPFIRLLEEQLRAIEVPGLPVTEELTAQIIHWWKIKTNERRPLLADEGKAYRMILSEYRSMARQRKALPPAALAALVNQLASQPGVLRISREINGSLTLFRRANANHYFIHVENHKITAAGTLEPATRVKQWTHVPAISKRACEILFTHPDIQHFPTTFHSKAIPDDRIEEAIELLRNRKSQDDSKEQIYLGSTREQDKITGFYCSRDRKASESPDLTVRTRPVHIHTDGTLAVSYGDSTSCFNHRDEKQEVVFNLDCSSIETTTFKIRKPNKNDRWGERAAEVINVDFNSEAFPTFIQWGTAWFDHRRRTNIIYKAVSKLVDKATHTVRQAWEQEEIRLYQEQGGDMEFWPDHLKTLPEFIGFDHKLQQSLSIILTALCRKHGSEFIRDLGTLRAIYRAGDGLTEADAPPDSWGLRENHKHHISTLRDRFSTYLDTKLITPPKQG